MHLETLQAWVTISASGTTSACIQEEDAWADLRNASAAVFYVDVRAATPISGGSLTLQLESSPTQDESLFTPCCPPLTLSPSTIVPTTTPIVLKTVNALSVGPLSRYVRWHVISSSYGTWSVTFRVRVARAKTPFFSPLTLPGCVLWLRADLGIASSGGLVSSWVDQSGTQPTLTNSGPVSLVLSSAFNGFPVVETSSGTLAVTGTTVSQADSMIMVCQGTTQMPTNYGAIFGGTAASEQVVSQRPNVTNIIGINAGSGVPVTLTSPITNATILQVDWNAGTTAFYQNGSSLAVTSSPGSGTIQVGVVGNNVGIYPFLGSVAEVMMFSPALTSPLRVLVNRYLGARYGISVP
jgi:hypothetical protein